MLFVACLRDACSHVQVSSYSCSALCEAAVRYSSPFQFLSIMASLEFYTKNTLEILPVSEIVAVVDAANSTRIFPFRLSEQPFLASHLYELFGTSFLFSVKAWCLQYNAVLTRHYVRVLVETKIRMSTKFPLMLILNKNT